MVKASVKPIESRAGMRNVAKESMFGVSGKKPSSDPLDSLFGGRKSMRKGKK